MNNEITGHADFNIGGTKFASLTSFTVSRFDDLRSGENKNPFYDSSFGERPFYAERINNKDSLVINDDQFIQRFSNYSQLDILQKFSFKNGEHVKHGLNLQYSTSSDVPRYDRLTDPAGSGLRYAEWYYGPQNRLMIAYDFNVKNDSAFFQHMHAGVNYQKIRESRHSRRFNNDALQNRIEDVNVAGANVDLQRHKNKHIIRIGGEIQFNDLKSTANEENISSGEISNLDTRYPDGKNTMTNTGVYWSHTLKLNEQFTLVDGIRLGYSSMHSTFIDKTYFDFPYSEVKQNNFLYSANLGLINCPSEKIKLSILFSSGFRVPNIDDLSKVFESSTGTLIVPNPDLKPEQTYNSEFGFAAMIGDKYFFENTVYYTRFNDAIVTGPFTYEGNDSIIFNGSNSKVYANQNERKAYLYGFSSALKGNHSDHFSSAIGINYNYGRIDTDTVDSPLDHIPPFSVHFELNYRTNKFDAGFYLNYNSWKRIDDYYLNGEDNEQYATPDGMPAWMTLNLRGSYEISSALALKAGVDNILDTQYRTFSSGINAPGRNIYLAIKFSFLK